MKAPEQQDPKRTSMLTYGLVFGPALGMLVALLFLGSEALGAGLAIGAALGIVIGALLDAAQEHRRRNR